MKHKMKALTKAHAFGRFAACLCAGLRPRRGWWLPVAILGMAGAGFRAARAETPSGVRVPDVSGDRYDWSRTLQPERPYVHPYHQTLVSKLFLAWKRDNDQRGPSRVVDGSSVYLTFEEALEVIRKLDRLTLGIPKIVYLVGWQHDGHDSKYPDWSVVNPRLKRPEDATAVDSLRWLMNEGFKYHTTVSLHVNLFDAYQDSPLWDTYLRNDILAKDRDGRLLLGEVGDLPGASPVPNTQVHYISYAREWETGFTRKRIDGLLAMLPIQRAGTIHVDAFHSLRPIPHAYPQERYSDQPKSDTRISPFLDYPLEREVAAQRRILRYFRDLGVDVTSEGSTFLRPDAFTGLQPMAWDYQPPAPGIPPSLYCGTPMRAEPEILRDPVNLTGLVAQFCERVVPWYYENNSTAAKGSQPVRDGDDGCVPALWRERTLVAFSRAGSSKRWVLPPGWDGVHQAVVSAITVDGPRRLRTVPVTDGAITLELAAGQGVVITAEPPLAEPPKPHGPVPNARQLKWHELEFYAFIHFTVNTFTDREWGFGDESPSVFNPTAFDADQIVRACKDGGMRGLILTAKHHDGFCLWPSKYTEHSVKHSPWKDGQGDMVKEFAAACEKHGLKFGIYVSPWDRNHAEYGRPGYVEYYQNQIRELLTQYGPIFEMWFDGASGGDGYYGGQGGARQIDYNTYYDWKGVRALVRELQPNCAIWCGQYREGDQLVWADCVWGGSEGGDVGDPCWHTRDSKKINVGIPDYQHGDRDGDVWCPAEGDVSIRPGWFYHASQDNQVKSPEQLMAIYFSCVGRGANLILNVPPDRRGQAHANDVKSLQGFGRLLAGTFRTDLARTGTPTASHFRGQDPTFGPANLIDGRRETYWATDDGVTTPEVVLGFTGPVTFNIVRLREYLPLGRRIDDWALDVWQEGRWQEFSKGSAIGACRLVRSKPHTTTQVRLRITKAAACPALSEFGLFLEPPPSSAARAGDPVNLTEIRKPRVASARKGDE